MTKNNDTGWSNLYYLDWIVFYSPCAKAKYLAQAVDLEYEYHQILWYSVRNKGTKVVSVDF